MPSRGDTITQLGHVNDLADAICLSLNNTRSINTIYNCSGKKGVTFKGLIESAALACGKSIDSLQLVSFDPSELNSKERKIFPLRLNHFLTDITLVTRDLDWEPKFDLIEGLKDSYNNDYLRNGGGLVDFTSDINLLGF